MIVSSNVTHWLMVDDIKVKIPPKGKGQAYVSSKAFSQSLDLMNLIEGGYVFADQSTIDGVQHMILDGESAYSVPSSDIWGNAPAAGLDWKPRESSEELPEKIEKKIKPKAEKRFRIRKNSPYGVCLDSVGVSLSKHAPAITLSESQYYNEGVQKAIASGSVALDQILEEKMVDDELEWVPVKERSGVDDPRLAPEGKPCVHWEGPIFDGGGYANMNRQLIFHLSDMGYHVKPHLTSTAMDVEESVEKKLMSMSHNMIPLQSPKVFGTTSPSPHSGRSIAYTMMETENVFHPLYIHKLLVADEIWVPCEWNRRVIHNSGIDKDIKVMPLGVDHKTYFPAPKSVHFSGGTKGFTFLSVFAWNWRKGFDVMLKAYIRAFTDKDDVSLVVVSKFAGSKEHSHLIHADIKKCTENERQENRPHLTLVDEFIPTYLMPRIYNSGDAFCLCSRGEGWGLPAIEAGVSGVPLLTSYHGGHEMFLNDDIASLVRPDMKSKWPSTYPSHSIYYDDMLFANYSDKAIDEYAEKMRWMYENRDEAQAKADMCRQNILSNFTWKHAAERVADRLSEIQP